MHTVNFIPTDWLERSAWAAVCGECLLVYGRPIQIERRVQTRRTADVELLLKTLLLAKAA
jgi:hypothetical protein